MKFQDGVLHIGPVSLPRLAEQFGTPFYVYDASVIRRQIERIRQAFAGFPLQPYYAAKANSNLALLRMIAEAGFGCDAVSPGEVFLAKRAAFPSDRIWFTCSNVSDADLLQLPDRGIVINVNSMSEIDRVTRLGLLNAIAIRVNPEVGAGHHRDVVTGGYGVKFGIDAAELEDARLVLEDAGLEIVGLHAHIGSGVSEVQPLLESARRLVELSERFNALRWLNFGGGLGVPYRPADQDFPIDEYARGLRAIAGEVVAARGIQAIIEPGRYVLAEAGTLVATVTALKVSAGTTWIGCDTGFNHLTRPSRYGSYHHILNASRGDSSWLRDQMTSSTSDSDHGAIVAGNICESGDVFTREDGELKPRRLPDTDVGDLLAFCDAGAYGFSMGSHYNARLLPPEILVDGEAVRLIRKRQEIDDLLQGQTDEAWQDPGATREDESEPRDEVRSSSSAERT
ncbi:MAG TPA: diaminopimelate decarboxylase [Thermoanaerobaculia bacterium]|nr:diaminopimelate decarboxylase [Thermoanaerobaculia bacterium]